MALKDAAFWSMALGGATGALLAGVVAVHAVRFGALAWSGTTLGVNLALLAMAGVLAASLRPQLARP